MSNKILIPIIIVWIGVMGYDSYQKVFNPKRTSIINNNYSNSNSKAMNVSIISGTIHSSQFNVVTWLSISNTDLIRLSGRELKWYGRTSLRDEAILLGQKLTMESLDPWQWPLVRITEYGMLIPKPHLKEK